MKKWFVEENVIGKEIGYRAIVDEEGTTICAPSPMGDDNANLIVAAPMLQEAALAAQFALNYYTRGATHAPKNDIEEKAAREKALALLAAALPVQRGAGLKNESREDTDCFVAAQERDRAEFLAAEDFRLKEAKDKKFEKDVSERVPSKDHFEQWARHTKETLPELQKRHASEIKEMREGFDYDNERLISGRCEDMPSDVKYQHRVVEEATNRTHAAELAALKHKQALLQKPDYTAQHAAMKAKKPTGGMKP